MKSDQSCDLWSKLLSLVKIVKFGQKIWNLVQIVKYCQNWEIIPASQRTVKDNQSYMSDGWIYLRPLVPA